MSKNLLKFIKKINSLIRESGANTDLLAVACDEVSIFMESTVVVADIYGKVLYKSEYKDIPFLLNVREEPDGWYIESQLNDQLKHISDYKENIALGNFHIKTISKAELDIYNVNAFAVCASFQRLATIIAYKEKALITPDDMGFNELLSIIASLLIKHARVEENAEEERKINIVKSAINTLSYSELEAILHIFAELDGNEGLLIASKIADRVGITRSVIVNALRKFESAGLIESRSLGMKGTYIKVLNGFLTDELNKMRS